MNKQTVIAALVATSYAAVCEDAFTKLRDKELADAKLAQTGAEGKVTDGGKLVEAAKAAAKIELDKWTPVNTQIAAFQGKLDAAKLAAKTALDAYNGASDGTKVETIDLGDTAALGLWNSAQVKMSFTAKKGDLTGLTTAKNDADKAKAKADGELATLDGLKVKYDAEKKRRDDQKILYDASLKTAKDEKVTFDAADAKAKQWIEVIKLTYAQTKDSSLLNAEKAKAGYDKLKATDLDKVAAWRAAEEASRLQKVTTDAKKGDMDTAYNTGVVGQVALEKDKYSYDIVYSVTDTCKTDGTSCKEGDKVFDDRKTKFDAYANLKTKVDDYNTAVTNYETEYDKQIKLDQTTDEAKLDMDAAGKIYTDAQTAADTAAQKLVAARQALVDSTVKAQKNADADCANTDAAIAAKKLEIARLVNNVKVAQHISELATDKFFAVQGVRDALSRKKDLAAAQQVLAQAALDRTVAHMKVYKDANDMAIASQGSAEGDLVKFKTAVADAKGKVTACTAAQTAAVARCKGIQYAKAQTVYKDWDTARVKNKETAAAVAAKYATDSKAPTDGAAGTRCEKPAKAADGTQAPRTKCTENKEAPLCCGSANKYLKDGTRLTVETCQTAKTTFAYKFFPKLKAGALVAPRSEMWRFYCIQGASKLAATLAAGVGAAYFMA